MTSPTLTPISPGFGVEIGGIDLRVPLGHETVAAIEDAMDTYAVAVFRDQPLDDHQQLGFTRNFGPLLAGANTTKTSAMRLDPYFADVSNVGADGELLDRHDRRRMFSIGNRLWHTDASFRQTPARYSILSGRAVPEHGGDTQFADMRAAYDALDPADRAMVERLTCEHSLIYSRQRLGFSDFTDDELTAMRPVRHPLVREHPVTGRRSLYLSAHIGGIVDWPVAEGLALLMELTESATERERVITHHWRPDDIVMWDNRQTMHRARRYDDTGVVRDLRRTTTLVHEERDLAQVIDH